MATHDKFDDAFLLIESGKVEELRELLEANPGLANSRDDDNASLLVRLIDWPGHRPRSAESAQVLIDLGVEVDARRDEKNGTALAGALCTNEYDVIHTLVNGGADVMAPLGWMEGDVLSFADRMCQDLGKQRDENIVALAKLFSEKSGQRIPSQVPFGGTVSILYVKDVEAAKDFYTQQLGFHVDWIHQEPDCDPYVGLSRGNANFHMTTCGCDDNRHEGNVWVRVECDQIDDLFKELDTDVVNVFMEPKNQPWGFRELDVEDPDGNRFTFFGPTTEE